MSWVGRDREGSEGTGGGEGRAAANPSGLGQDRVPDPLGFVPSDLQISHSFIHSFSEHHWAPTSQSGCWAPGEPTREPGRGPGWKFHLQKAAFVLLRGVSLLPCVMPTDWKSRPWLMCLSHVDLTGNGLGGSCTPLHPWR